MKGKPRIELNPEQPGLHAAFAGLDLAGLPAGPEPAGIATGPAAPPKRGRVILRRETAHRGGKAVLVIHDFAAHITAEEIAALAQRLRAACGCGGTIQHRQIELQGNPIAQVRELLVGEGYQVAGVR